MNNGEFWHLKHVSDAGLRRELGVLLASDARTEARIVAHLAEVDRRKLYVKDGFSCLFNYCQGQLGLSESQAFHRMTAARLARQFPLVFGMIEQRRIHLSGLVELRDFLTADNHRDLLELAAGKSKRQIRELLATRFPGQSVPDAVRKLPTGRVVPLIASAEPFDEPPFSKSAAPLFDPVTGEVSQSCNEAEPGSKHKDQATAPVLDSSARPIPAPERAPTAPPEVRYRIQFDAGSALKAKLELARALSSHSNPRGDLETLFERALDAYVEQLQKRRFAQVGRPRAEVPKSEPRTTRRPEASAEATARAVRQLERTRVRGRRLEQRAHLSHETRRAVVERSGMRCSFVAPNGKRCDEQAFLQFHHEHPWSRHGSDEAENLALLCASHNRLLAEREFGSRHVEQRIAEARAVSRGPREESGG